MKQKRLSLPFLMVFLFKLMSVDLLYADQTIWTEEKIGKAAVRADKAAMRKKWSRAIKHGLLTVEGNMALHGQDDPNTISSLKNLNRYYDKSGRLSEVPGQVKRTYLLSKKHFKPAHNTAVISRLLYYKLLLSQKNYYGAIPLVHENLAILTQSKDDAFKRLHYYGQLHGLYGATGQLKAQEKLLFRQITLYERLIGIDKEDHFKIIMNLAKNYCLQKKPVEFRQLMQKYDLKYMC